MPKLVPRRLRIRFFPVNQQFFEAVAQRTPGDFVRLGLFSIVFHLVVFELLPLFRFLKFVFVLFLSTVPQFLENVAAKLGLRSFLLYFFPFVYQLSPIKNLARLFFHVTI